ncbi:2,3-bisphosphoglycerate-independent phosphoglycerate mutase [Patescibacteria group bacterium]|nr:2,3-bisphosphoglycerate-independent phosphoglycerate mutase [Patescibacteria group bacterium]
MKILLIIIDGLGDESIPQLGNKTPLEVAYTPNLDFLAKNGICGLVEPTFHTAIPTSEESHLALFGYDARAYRIRRGIFTVLGTGMKIKAGDVALRGNFGTVDENKNMIDRRAGRIKNTQPLIESLNGMVIDGVKFLLKPAGEHRVGIILRGRNLSSQISDGDPHYGKLGKRAKKIIPLDKSYQAKFTAKVLSKFLEKAHQVFKDHPLNKKRKKTGLPPANYILVRGASSLQRIPGFQEKYKLKACCIAGKILYQQIGKILGMDLIRVKGANGLTTTNLKGKFEAAKRSLKKYDFVFLHIKATDSLAEDGNFIGKKKFIEKIDKDLKSILNLKNTLIVITADHSTCSLLKRHCKKLIPILVYNAKGDISSKARYKKGLKSDKVSEFSEKACEKGKLGKIKQINLMPKILLYSK